MNPPQIFSWWFTMGVVTFAATIVSVLVSFEEDFKKSVWDAMRPRLPTVNEEVEQFVLLAFAVICWPIVIIALIFTAPGRK